MRAIEIERTSRCISVPGVCGKRFAVTGWRGPLEPNGCEVWPGRGDGSTLNPAGRVLSFEVRRKIFLAGLEPDGTWVCIRA